MSGHCVFIHGGSILFVFQFVNKIVNKMNAFSVSNLHRATATHFWRGTARRGHVSRLLFRFRRRNWSNVGLETRKCSFHCLYISALFSISLCQYCRREYTHKDFCEPLGLLAFATTPTLSQQRQTSTAFPYLTIIFNYMWNHYFQTEPTRKKLFD